MGRILYLKAPVVIVALAAIVSCNDVRATGESIDGYPNWNERVLLEWMNRARSNPQADLASCPSGNCAEQACYATASPPRYMIDDLEHSSRFHSSHLMLNGYFDHPSHCTIKPTIDSLYPATCNGVASCSCTQGALTTDTSKWTDPFTRMTYFGVGNSSWSEIIAAGYSGPDQTFYGWLYEPTANPACGDHTNDDNGHRYILLTNAYGENAGAGYLVNPGGVAGTYGSYATMDFAGTAIAHPEIPSGSHYPQQASSVDAWVNWYDNAAPSASKIDVDGTCSNMTLARGTSTNGAWHLSVTNVGTGCHHYVFAFKDSSGKEVIYPTTGALTIGNGGAQCPDFSEAPPPGCSGFDRIFVNGVDL